MNTECKEYVCCHEFVKKFKGKFKENLKETAFKVVIACAVIKIKKSQMFVVFKANFQVQIETE